MADLNFTDPFPPPDRYPLNSPSGKVLPWVRQELGGGPTLVITGYSSLEFLVRELSGLPVGQRIRVLIGQEPVLRVSALRHREVPIDRKMREWWVEQGFSILSGGAVQNVVARLDRGELQFKLLDQLHAKIVVGPGAAILGSSNFSHAGLTSLKEANVRREAASPEYGEIQQIAEAYWLEGRPADAIIRNLLLELVKPMSWQEVLAIAGSLLLEGDWLKRIPELARRFDGLQLWESQKQALSQALYLLDTFGDSLLIADPTGSGKTRLGAGLHLLLLLRLYILGQSDRTRTLIVTPPQVKPNWEKEFAELDANQPEVISQGLLSRPDSGEGVSTANSLKGCRVLFLDEAHNYLNQKSNRSTSLLGHGADHTVLFTATPINRRTEDLFRVLVLMDPDNLSDAALKTFDDWGIHRRPQNESAMVEIRRQISQFTIRRTKGDLNSFIARHPEGYTRPKTLSDGTKAIVFCRYPSTRSQTYRLEETASDLEAAKEIDKLSWNLKGLIYLRKLTATPDELSSADKQQKFLDGRIKVANALAAWNIKAMLRSSRAALLEHIEGTAAAAREFGLNLGDKKTGDLVGSLMRNGFPLPHHKLTIPLPTWMTDPQERERVLVSEIETYRAIAHWCRRISDQRDRAKVKLLTSLTAKNDRILAFDSKVITLAHFQKLLGEQADPANVLVVTGGRKEEQKRARELFGLDSEEKGWIGLCSDAMAEGVNLQGARCLVLLDMPTVMRLAEQRIGRIDRMNSPFDSIEVWWPEDHADFALKTDLKFFVTAESVKNLLGSNIDIPINLTDRSDLSPVTGSTAIKLWEDNAKQADETAGPSTIHDAFQDLKGMFWGSRALVSREIYDLAGALRAKIVWATVRSARRWALIVTDEGLKAPRWTLWTPDRVTIDLGETVQFLRTVLPPPDETLPPAPTDGQILEVCRALEGHELELLPHKKRRALMVLAKLIGIWDVADAIPKEVRSALVQWSQSILPAGSLFAAHAQDASRYHLSNLARRWLEIAEPHLAPLRSGWRKRRFLSWGHPEVYKTLKAKRLASSEWEQLAKELEARAPLEQRIKAVLWGGL